MSITTEDGKPCEGLEQGPFEPIAVIGVGAMMPDANSIDTFWQNILDQKISHPRFLISSVPRDSSQRVRPAIRVVAGDARGRGIIIIKHRYD